jgi:hypothetical protein
MTTILYAQASCFRVARFSEVGPRHNFQEHHCPAIPTRFIFWCASPSCSGGLSQWRIGSIVCRRHR